jgi:hypothetical protein
MRNSALSRRLDRIEAVKAFASDAFSSLTAKQIDLVIEHFPLTTQSAAELLGWSEEKADVFLRRWRLEASRSEFAEMSNDELDAYIEQRLDRDGRSGNA